MNQLDYQSSKLRFRISTVLSCFLVIAIGLGWHVDRTSLISQQLTLVADHEREIDRLHMGLSLHEECRTLASTYRKFKQVECDEFERHLRFRLFQTILTIYPYRDRVDEVNFEEADATKQARDVVALLGCNSPNEFLAEATKLGMDEDSFLPTYEPKPGELEEFYRFLGFKEEIATNAAEEKSDK